jgi:hypothetical protein
MKNYIFLHLALLIQTPLFASIQNTEIDAQSDEGAVVTCVICLEDSPINTLTKLACNHYFDAACIFTWLLESNTCPVCKANPEELRKKNNDLLWHAEKGHTSVVKKLLAAGAKIETTNGTGWTPLILAAHFGRLAVVQALLAAGANLHATTAEGQTASLQAREKNHPRVAKALMAAGAY